MTTALALLILIAPFVVAAVLSWSARRSGSLRARIDRLRVSAPIGRFFDRDRDGSALSMTWTPSVPDSSRSCSGRCELPRRV